MASTLVKFDAAVFLLLEADKRGISPDSFSDDHLNAIGLGIRGHANRSSDPDSKAHFLEVANFVDELATLSNEDLTFLESITKPTK